MPFVKLSGAFSNLTGKHGRFEFKEGVSVDNLAWADAERLGASMRVFDADTGEQISRIKQFAESRGKSLAPKPQMKPVAPATKVEVAPEPNYTREQLEKIADESGLKGIREFAEPYAVRGTSIIGIIDDLMKKVSTK